MNISDAYTWKTDECSKRDYNPLLPSNIRALIIGKSNCGKTTLLLNSLLQPHWLDYNPLYLFGRSLHQQEYTENTEKRIRSGLSKSQVACLYWDSRIIAEKCGVKRATILSPLI